LDHLHPVINFLANNAILLLRQLDLEIKDASRSKRSGTRPSVEISKMISEFPGFFSQLLDELDARMRGVLQEMDTKPEGLRSTFVKSWNASSDK
jgi:hypothetical protein